MDDREADDPGRDCGAPARACAADRQADERAVKRKQREQVTDLLERVRRREHVVVSGYTDHDEQAGHHRGIGGKLGTARSQSAAPGDKCARDEREQHPPDGQRDPGDRTGEGIVKPAEAADKLPEPDAEDRELARDLVL